MLQLTFKQTQAEMIVRSAATILFNKLFQEFSIVELSELAESPQYGLTASATSELGGPKFVRITDLKDGGINWETVPFCRCDDAQKYTLETDDILFARTGATTGKTHLVKEARNAVFASYLIRLRPNKEVSANYLYSFFQSDLYWSQILEEKKGSAQPNVNGKKLVTIRLPIVEPETQHAVSNFLEVVRRRQDGSLESLPELPPPIAEQRRIVARIEELAAKIEEVRGLREGAIEVLRLLSERKLSETFSQLSTRYSSKELSTIILKSEYGTSTKCGFQKGSESIPVLRIPNVSSEEVNFHEIKYGILSEKEAEKTTLKQGDVLIVRTNGSADLVGRSAVVPDLSEDVSFASYLIRLRCNQEIVTPAYLQLTLKYLRTSGQLFDLARTTAGQYNVSLGRLNSSKIPLPPLTLQSEIVENFHNLQRNINLVEKERIEALKEFDALLPAILDKAFKGEL